MTTDERLTRLEHALQNVYLVKRSLESGNPDLTTADKIEILGWIAQSIESVEFDIVESTNEQNG